MGRRLYFGEINALVAPRKQKHIDKTKSMVYNIIVINLIVIILYFLEEK